MNSTPAAEPNRSKLLVIAGYGPSLVNFRGELVRSISALGVQVWCTAPEDDSAIRERVESLGARYLPVFMRRNQTGLVGDLRYGIELWRLCRRLRPDRVLAYTAKPIVYGLQAARLAGVRRRYALVTGLGYAFTEGGGWRRRGTAFVLRQLYRLALAGSTQVIFQNPDDCELFRSWGLVSQNRSCVVNGSGVDTVKFSVVPLPAGPITFLLIARLLGDKGIREYVEAARRIRAEYANVNFELVGPTDPHPSAIPLAEVHAWHAQGVVCYRGEMSDVRPAIAGATVYVLPSYREGTPRTVLEAMAMGRPVITTDVPGCRETVQDGVNGFLVKPRDVNSLVAAMRRFVEQPELARKMGTESRRIAEDRYDVHKVNAVMLREMGLHFSPRA